MDERHCWVALLLLSCVLHGLVFDLDLFRMSRSTQESAPVSLETVSPQQQTSDALALTAEMLATEANKPNQSAADKRRSLLAQYLHKVRQRIERHKFPPRADNGSDLIGKAKYALTITGEGCFTNVHLVHSSGVARLDKTALLAIRTASGQVKRPPATGSRPLFLQVTVKYQHGL
jgi:TonB family protein